MDDDTSVAAIIPTYNRAQHVLQALASVYRQTHPVTEIIVVDDGSTDATEQQVRKQFPEVSFYWQTNAGVSAARNTAIRQSKSRWLALLDSDDLWQPEKIAQQLAALANTAKYRVCHCEELWFRHGKRVNPMHKHRKQGGWIFDACLARCAISPSSAMIRRDVFEEIGMFDETLPVCEDYDLWLRITCVEPVLLVDQPLVIKFGGHADQLSHAYWGMDRFRIRALSKLLECETLNQDQQYRVRDTLRKKLEILIKGGKKHHNLALLESLKPYLVYLQS